MVTFKRILLFTDTPSLIYEIETEDQNHIKTQCHIKIINSSISFSIDIQSSSVL